MEDKEALILLNMVDGLGPGRIQKLVECYHKPAKLPFLSIDELSKTLGISLESARDIAVQIKEKEGLLAEELSLIKREQAQVVTFIDEDYPPLLKEIASLPPVLYIRGNLHTTYNIAIVGARTASYYGRSIAERFGFMLSQAGWVVVSGLARGIDTAAHKGALKSNSPTMAILGSGLSYIYPEENFRLSMEIVEKGGALISEFPIQTRPFSYNFPRRNRIISGLSLGVVIVEAGKHSGSLITARYALEQNREVFAVPGEINNFNTRGTNNLIKQGAKLVEDIGDILEEFKGQSPLTDSHLGPQSIDTPDGHLEGLTDQEKEIMSILRNKPVYIDKIVEQLAISVQEVSGILMLLELKGLVRQLPGKLFVKR